MSGVLKNLTRRFLCAQNGEELDHSACPAYRLHFHQLTQFYWLTKDYQLSQAALSCFAPAMVRAAFGRTAEISDMSWDEVRWDEHAQVATVCWYEMKTSKTKAFAVAAGKTREDCVYLKSGDWLATNQVAAPAYDSSSQDAYVFPAFKSKRNAGRPPVLPAQCHLVTGLLIETLVWCRQDHRYNDERRT